MPRRRLALVIAIVAAVLLWRPVLYPGGKATVLLLDVYAPALVGVNVAALITPEPRHHETREMIAGLEMRVDWWRPGWGNTHPALLIVNGATPVGNDNAATRQFAASLARAGYLVMLPELPFLKEGRLDTAAPAVADAAFAFLRQRPEVSEQPAGAFGASVGAGIMLAAAGSEPALARADHLTVLGGYFDLDTYVASVAARSQGQPPVPWEPSPEASERIPVGVFMAMTNDADRLAVLETFAAPSYAAALRKLASLSPDGRAVFDRLSPSSVWSEIGPPVFWIHDPADSYEPLSEAYAARDAERDGRMSLVVPRLIQHAQVSEGAGAQGPLFVLGELWSLLTFTLEVLRLAG